MNFLFSSLVGKLIDINCARDLKFQPNTNKKLSIRRLITMLVNNRISERARKSINGIIIRFVSSKSRFPLLRDQYTIDLLLK